MKLLLLLILFFLIGQLTFAQSKLKTDSSVVEARSFNDEAIQKFKRDKQFNYEQLKEPPQSLWNRFWRWVWFKIAQILSTKTGRRTVWTVFVIIALAIIAFFVFKVTGMNREGLFARNDGKGINYNVSSDDIHAISFDEAIQQAIVSGNYRLAIRLLYLQCLKKLSDKGFIDWKINKTNTDYLKEVSGQKWASLFSSLTYNFDYTWYGEMQVNKERFEEVKEYFNNFNNQL